VSALYRLPTWLFGVVVVLFFVLAAVGGLLLFRRGAGRLQLTEEMNNDIIFFASAIGVFYSLTVGLIAVGVWGDYSEVKRVVSQEAASIAALFRDVSGYPEPIRTELRDGVRSYTQFVIDSAWPAQLAGQVPDGGTAVLTRFQERLFAFEPGTAGQQALHGETLRQFNHLVELRRLRLDAVRGGLPGVMWGIVLIGAFLSVSVTWLLKIEPVIHAVLTAFLAMFIGLVAFVVAGLDRPLTGPLAIQPDAYRLVLERLIQLR
jgi:hypothetical protein